MSGIPSGLYSHVLPGILFGFVSDIWRSPLRSDSAHWHVAFGLAVPIEIWSSRVGSGSAHWALEFAVGVRQCFWDLVLTLEVRQWNLALAVEVWQCLLSLQLKVGELEDEEEKEEAEELLGSTAPIPANILAESVGTKTESHGLKTWPQPQKYSQSKKNTSMFPWLKTRGCEVTLHLTTYMLQVAETIGAWDAGQHTHILLNLSHPVEPPRNTNFLPTALGISEIPTVSPGFSQILWRIWSTGTEHMKKNQWALVS